MDSIIEIDKKLLLLLNGWHHPWIDPVMYYLTQTFFWLPLYAFLIFLIFKSYGKQGWYILIGAALTVTLADQITGSLMKPFFARFRPSHEPTLEGLVHIVKNYRGGLYGFASSHAANTFGTALFVWSALRSKYKGVAWIFLWAAVMTYTRIYLGVHYPGDILVGGLVGLISGWVGFRFAGWLMRRTEKTGVTAP